MDVRPRIQKCRWTRGWICPLGLVLCILPVVPVYAAPSGSDTVRASGVTGGLVVHIGNDPQITASLLVNDRYLVQGLYRDGVEKAREAIAAKGLYGRVSVAEFDGSSLPYSDNLVNLLVVDGESPVDEKEIVRVLAPRGVALVDGKRIVKAVPADIDDWTHYLHGPSNNAVARDSRIAPPYHTQWEGGPRWQRSHDYLASLSALVSSEGKLFYIHDEGERSTIALPAKWFLVARDAFNGIVLWKRSIETWESHFQRFRVGPVDLSRRLVAVDGKVYVTLGYGRPVSVLDAATGETLLEYEGTEGAHEIIVEGNAVYVSVVKESSEQLKLETEALRARLYGRTSPQAKAAAARLPWKTNRRGARYSGPEKAVMAIHAETGEVLWERKDATEGLRLNTLTAGGELVFYQNGETLYCLDAKTGSVNWEVNRGEAQSYSGQQSPTVVLHKDVLLWAAKDPAYDPREKAEKNEAAKVGKPRITGTLIAYSAEDGKELWSCPTGETFHAPFEVFVMEDVVWTGGVSKPDEPGLTEGRDYKTGKVVRTRPPSPVLYQIVGHASCYRNKATERFLLMNRAGVDFIDVKEGKAFSNHFVRGACQYGILPANGYVYTTPHACNCYIYAKLSGYVAMAGKRYMVPDVPDNVLETGPAYEKSSAPDTQQSATDWPTYRYDNSRSSAIKGCVPSAVERAWELPLGGDLTQPVAAADLLYLARRDAHTLFAIGIDSGKENWRFIAGGEVDSPPTIHDGRALFGCADGWVYCLDAATGELAWRFRAAHNNQQIVSYGKLKSVWPVTGNILVLDGAAYFAAGRTSYMDGGIFIYKLDATTGKRLAVHRIYDRDPKTDLEYSEVEDIRRLEGALPDILSSDGESLFLRHRRFSLDLDELPQDVPHLFSSVGFLDDDWWHRSFWQLGTKVRSGFGGWGSTGNNTISGQLLSFDDANVYGFGHKVYGNKIYHGLPTKYGHYRLFSMPKSNLAVSRIKMADEIPPEKRREYLAVKRQAFEFHWEQRINVLARAIVLAGDKLVVAGPPDVIADESLEPAQYNLESILDKLETQNDVFAGKRHGILLVVSTDDGRILSEQNLQSPPVFNGMITSGGKLFITDTKGRLVCYRQAS